MGCFVFFCFAFSLSAASGKISSFVEQTKIFLPLKELVGKCCRVAVSVCILVHGVLKRFMNSGLWCSFHPYGRGDLDDRFISTDYNNGEFIWLFY